MLIKAITLENFKGIRERQRIELAPITLLFGPNSSGKSTVLQALLYTWEILEWHNLDPDRTLLGGESVDLGGFDSLVHGHDRNVAIGIGYELEIGEGYLNTYISDSEYDALEDRIEGAGPFVRSVGLEVRDFGLHFTLRWSDTLERPIVETVEVAADGQLAARLRSAPDGRSVQLEYLDVFHPYFAHGWLDPSNDKHKALIDRVEETKLSILEPLEIDLGEEIGAVDIGGGYDPLPVVQHRGKVGLLWWFKNFLDSEFASKLADDWPALILPLRDQPDALPRLGQPLALEFGDAYEGEGYPAICRNLITMALSMLVVGPLDRLHEELTRFRYIGPLREVPGRFAARRRSPNSVNWSRGQAAWNVLHERGPEFIAALNRWLGPQGLRTGYSVKVERFRELRVDDPISLSLMDNAMFDKPELHDDFKALPVRTRLMLRDERGLELQPMDVGVGVSQVFPIVVAALDQSAGILAVEQPELHIHPAMQVELSDLFAQQIQATEIQYLLETHSEHLMLRLLRRVRETAEGDLEPGAPALKPDDLAVYYLNNTEEGVTLTRLRVDEDGDFKDRWPQGFFPERAGELF